jgi:hypothetical protein
MEEADFGSPDAEMWKLCPEPVLSIEDSTEGKGSGSFGPSGSGGGGVKAFCSGDAVYCCCWKCPGGLNPGGKDDLLPFPAFAAFGAGWKLGD